MKHSPKNSQSEFYVVEITDDVPSQETVQQIAMFGVNSDVQGIELWHNYFFLDE